MSRERAALEAAIDEAPDDPARYGVLSDWLQQQGEARGELMALQLPPLRESRERRAREEVLLQAPGVRLPQGPRALWRWGFVHTLFFELVRSAAWEEHREDWTTALLAPALEHPSCRFLRELVVDASPGDDTLRYLALRAPRHLEALSLVCNELELGGLRGGLARLRKLQLSAQLIVPAPLELPHLQELALPADALTIGGLGVVLAALPALERLTLSSLERLDQEALFPVTRLTRLRSLTLRAEQTTGSAVEALVDSPLLDSLEALDVSRSGLTEDAAQRLLKAVPKFARLDSLVLGDAA